MLTYFKIPLRVIAIPFLCQVLISLLCAGLYFMAVKHYKEQWAIITEFNQYAISNLGRIKSLKPYRKGPVADRGGIIIPTRNIKGYLRISFWIDGKKYSRSVHRLVAEAFIPNPLNKGQVNHIDCDKLNNCVSNLEWVTNYENHKHAVDNGLKRHKTKPVKMLDPNTKDVIKVFNSMNEAANYVNIHPSSITHCLRGDSDTSGGYKWAYVNV